MQEQIHLRVRRRRRGGLHPQIKVGRHQGRRPGTRRDQPGHGGRVDVGCTQPLVERTHPEVDVLSGGDRGKRLPGVAQPVPVDRIVGPLRHALGRGQNGPRGLDRATGTIHAPEALAQRIKGSGFRHQAIQVKVDPHFEALGGDHHERRGCRTFLVVAGAERFELAFDLAPVDIARAADQQQAIERSILGFAQPREDRARQVDPVHHHADRGGSHPFAAQPVGHVAGGAREGCGGVVADRLHQPRRLGALDARLENRVGTIFKAELERTLVAAPRRGCEHHRRYVRATDLVHRLQRLQEGLGQVCLIEQDQAVLAQQAGVHRLHPIRDAVAAEQEPRTRLVDGGAQDGRLRRGTRPVVLQRHTAAQPLRHQRRLVAAGEPLQPPRDLGDHAAASLRAPRRVAQDGGDPLGATIGVVNHQAPIHHQDNPQRSAAPRAVRLQRQMEHRNIERCRLAAAGRQVQHVRPPVIARELLDEPLLPWEWVMAVNGAKEGGEVGRGQRHHPAVPTSRRQSPSPVYRPAPSITGPATSQPKSMATWVSSRLRSASGTCQRGHGGAPGRGHDGGTPAIAECLPTWMRSGSGRGKPTFAHESAISSRILPSS